MAASQLRTIGAFARTLRVAPRAFSTSSRYLEVAASVPATAKTETAVEEAREIGQAPNRVDVWSRSQKPRTTAMTGPRFEQTDFDLQVSAAHAERGARL